MQGLHVPPAFTGRSLAANSSRNDILHCQSTRFKCARRLRPFARDTIRKVLDEAAQLGELEFVNDVARAITGRVIMRMLGVPEAYLGRLKKSSLDLNTAFGSAQPPAEALEAAEQSLAEMTELFRTEIARRRQAPTDDFLSQLVQARDGDDALSEEELMGICYITLVSGHDTTMNSMALGVVALSSNEPARRFLPDHPDRITDSVMEVMRYSAMATAQPRIVSADFEWHDIFRRFERVEVLDERLSFAPSLAFRGLESLHVRLLPRRA